MANDDIKKQLIDGGVSAESLEPAVKVLSKILEKQEDQVNLAKALVGVLKQVNIANDGILKSSKGQLDFQKQILSNTDARRLIQRQLATEAEGSQSNLIKLQAARIANEETLYDLQVQQSDAQGKYNEEVDASKKVTEIANAEISALKSMNVAVIAERKKLINDIRDKDLTSEMTKDAIDRIKLLQDIMFYNKKLIDVERKKIKDADTQVNAAAVVLDGLNDQVEQHRQITAATDDVIKKQQDLIKESNRLLKLTKQQAGYIAHIKDTGNEVAKVFGHIGTGAMEFAKKIKDTPKMFLIMDLLILSALKRFKDLDKAASEFRKETGFSINQMKQLRVDAEAVNREFQDMGVGIDEVYKSAKALTEVFGRTSLVTKETLGNVSLLAANLGVAEADSANVLANFTGLGGVTEEAAMNVIKVGAGISEKAGIPFKMVMQDVANASQETTALLGSNPTKLMKSAIAARALGTDLNKIVSSQRRLLDYSSSINDELEASALLGKSLSFQRARQLAYEGDIEGAAKATLDTIKKAGNFNEMNVYQREALAKASGMELKDITKMMAVEKQRDAILKGNDKAKRDTLLKQEAELENLKKIADMNDADLVKNNKKVLMQQKMQSLMTQLNNAFESMFVSVGDVLEPLVTSLVTVIVPVFRIVAALLRVAIIPLLKAALYPVKIVGEMLNGWAESLNEGREAVEEFFAPLNVAIKEMGELGKWAVGLGSMGLLGLIFFGKAGVGSLVSGIGSVFKTLRPSKIIEGYSAAKQSIGGFFTRLKEGGIKGMFKKPADMAKNLEKSPEISGKAGTGIEKTADATKNVKSGTGVKDFLTNLSEGLKKMGESGVVKGALNLILSAPGLLAISPVALVASVLGVVGKLVEKGLQSLATGISYMGDQKVFKGALGMAAVGASIIPFAVAMTMFSNVDWGAVGIGSLALVGFTAAAFGLGALLSTGVGAAIFTAGVIGIAALGASLIPFGAAALIAGAGIKMFGEGIKDSVDPIIKLSEINLTKTALGIGALGVALASFGTGAAAAGLGSFVGGFLGGDPIKKMEKLASVGDKLRVTADSIRQISTAMSSFSSVDKFSKSIDLLAVSLENLNESIENVSVVKLAAISALSASSTNSDVKESKAPTSTLDAAGIEAKLDRLTDLLVGGAVRVYLDGKDVSAAMSGIGR